jgi:hypothetical protein
LGVGVVPVRFARANRQTDGCSPEVVNMTRHETTSQEAFIIEDGIEVPESALLRVERNSGFGSVAGLADEELADSEELERQVTLAEWGPILTLPCRGFDGGIRPVIDEFGKLDWGAFGTWDYERLRGPFDKARYKADKLQEQLQWALIMFSMVQERLSVQARLDVAARIRAGVDLDDFDDMNEYAYARWYLRTRSLRNQIRELRAASWRRRHGAQDA